MSANNNSNNNSKSKKDHFIEKHKLCLLYHDSTREIYISDKLDKRGNNKMYTWHGHNHDCKRSLDYKPRNESKRMRVNIDHDHGNGAGLYVAIPDNISL